MTPERRALALWGGIGGAVALAGWGWLLLRSSQLDDARTQAAALQTGLAETYLPDRPAEAERYAADLKKQQERQEEALRTAEGQLVPELKREYQATDLLGAQARLRADVLALRSRAERSRITLPGALPFESGLDQDEAARALQLAFLGCVRASLDLAMDAGVAQIAACTVGKGFSDPSGSYAELPCELEVEGTPEAVQSLLQAFALAHRQGIGLRRADIDGHGAPAGKAPATQRARLTVGLLVRNRPEWQLKPEAPPSVRAAPGKPAPAAAAPARSGGLGRPTPAPAPKPEAKP